MKRKPTKRRGVKLARRGSRPKRYEEIMAKLLGVRVAVAQRLSELHTGTGIYGELQDLEAVMERINTLSIEARHWLFARLKTYWPDFFQSDEQGPRPPQEK